MNNLTEVAQKFLFRVRMKEDVSDLIQKFAQWDREALLRELSDDSAKKAFWVNCYNGFTQYFLHQNKSVLLEKEQRRIHFREKKISIAGMELSLDDIEHGILRKSRIWWSLGALGKLFPPPWEKLLRVKKLDHRIHFALNCGGESCPPIRYYEPEKLEEQLDLASRAFISLESELLPSVNKVRLSRIFLWYRFDFGGKKGIKRLLKTYEVIPRDSNPGFIYKTYNWNPDPEPFAGN